MDTIVGTAGNDTINGTTATLNSFDSVKGGAGTDTFNYADTSAAAFAVPVSVTFAELENVNVSRASTAVNTGAVTITNTTFGTGVQKLNYTEASVAANMTGAAVDITLNSATDVTVASKGTGTFTTVAITDKSTTAADRGATLKNVSIEKALNAVTLHGNAIETVSLNAVAGLTTVNAAAGARALTVNASGTTTQGGLTDAQATSATLNISGAQSFGTLTTAKAAEVTINSNAAATAVVVAATAKTLNIGGSNLLGLTAGAGNAALETVKVSGAGGVTADLSGVNTLTSVDTTGSTAAAPVSGVLTGANSITIGTGVAYVGGAGQDVVTVAATTKAVNLGAGNDTVNLSVTALGVGGSVNGGEGIDTLKLSNANAVTLSAAGAPQTAFKAAVTGFETLDITAMGATTIALNGFGTFNKAVMATAGVTQTFSGVSTETTFRMNHGGVDATGVTINALTSGSDVINFELAGDLSAAAVKAFGTLTLPGVETVNLNMVDTNAAFTARLATANVLDAAAQVINVSGNNGLALTHAGTALHTLNASGLTKGGITFTSGALSTDATVTGSATGDDTLNFANSLGKVTITEAAGTNALTGSLTAANTITGGSGLDTIVGGNLADTIKVGAGATGNTVTAGAGADSIDLTGSTGVDQIVIGDADSGITLATADTIIGFTTGIDKLVLGSNGTAANTTINAVAVADFAAAKAVADAAFSAGALLEYYVVNDAANTYVFIDNTPVGTAAEQVVVLTGVQNLAVTDIALAAV